MSVLPPKLQVADSSKRAASMCQGQRLSSSVSIARSIENIGSIAGGVVIV
jgi:hypothetical protein